MKEQILPALIDLLSAVLLAALAVLAHKAQDFLRRKTNNEELSSIEQRLTRAVFQSVTSIAQSYTDDLKLKAADGKLTTQERAAAREMALHQTKERLRSALPLLEKALGLDTPDALDKFLFAQIEAAVGEMKSFAAPRPLVQISQLDTTTIAPTGPS